MLRRWGQNALWVGLCAAAAMALGIATARAQDPANDTGAFGTDYTVPPAVGRLAVDAGMSATQSGTAAAAQPTQSGQVGSPAAGTGTAYEQGPATGAGAQGIGGAGAAGVGVGGAGATTAEPGTQPGAGQSFGPGASTGATTGTATTERQGAAPQSGANQVPIETGRRGATGVGGAGTEEMPAVTEPGSKDERAVEKKEEQIREKPTADDHTNIIVYGPNGVEEAPPKHRRGVGGAGPGPAEGTKKAPRKGKRGGAPVNQGAPDAGS